MAYLSGGAAKVSDRGGGGSASEEVYCPSPLKLGAVENYSEQFSETAIREETW
jgi:hypothetical protein